ncbi:KISS1R [Branchiostoma lanceolatum]|uniref:KISS1R protein n=1 Tax=Branchiostoma lanceolatum TaxID=7740 RepID=A0A8J9VDX9_BRALA|nr:KISS1R [Branchiostoma lanceolatum]
MDTVTPYPTGDFTAAGGWVSSTESPNTTDPGEGPTLGPEADIVPVIFAIICLVGVAGNSFVIYMVYRFVELRTVTNYYIVNLAVTDLAFLICCVPFSAAKIATPSWEFGEFLCKFIFYFMQVTVQATCLTLAAVSIDRYLCVVKPFESLNIRTPKTCLAVSGAIWIGSFLLSLPLPIHMTTVTHDWYGPRTLCTEVWPSHMARQAYMIYTFLISYVIPLVTSLTSHSLIIRHLCLRVQVLNHIQQQAIKRKKKVTRMVAVVVSLFTLFWLPNHVMNLWWMAAQPKQVSHVVFIVKVVSLCLCYCSSAINPFVYAILGDNYRRCFKKLFPRFFRTNAVVPVVDNQSSGSKYVHRPRQLNIPGSSNVNTLPNQLETQSTARKVQAGPSHVFELDG